MQRNSFTRLVADGDCPKCGGAVGSHSDMCLDCGYDTCPLFPEWSMVRDILFALLLILVGFIGGLCTEIKRTRNFEYVRNEAGEIEKINLKGERFTVGFKGVHDYATFNESTGAAPVIKAHPIK